jgi:hypothetical protein
MLRKASPNSSKNRIEIGAVLVESLGWLTFVSVMIFSFQLFLVSAFSERD